MWPHRQQPTRLPRPWDSPGKNTGVGCHFLLQCMKVKVKSLRCVRPSAITWTAAYQAPSSIGFSRQEYWSGVPLPSPTIRTGVGKLRRPYSKILLRLGFCHSNWECSIPLSSTTKEKVQITSNKKTVVKWTSEGQECTKKPSWGKVEREDLACRAKLTL